MVNQPVLRGGLARRSSRRSQRGIPLRISVTTPPGDTRAMKGRGWPISMRFIFGSALTNA